MNSAVEAIVTIASLIVGVAILAVIVSKKSDTSSVIQAAGTAFSSGLAVAIAPITGAVPQANLAYPGQTGIMGATNAGISGYSR